MAYVEADLIIAGAPEETRFFKTQQQLDAWVRGISIESDEEKESTGCVEHWDVYVVWHDHALLDDDMHGECICAEFKTDHHPYWRNWDELSFK